ncbi:MAG: hypothetical protein AAF961_05875 [Planctomycetota bacterium]
MNGKQHDCDPHVPREFAELPTYRCALRPRALPQLRCRVDPHALVARARFTPLARRIGQVDGNCSIRACNGIDQ